MLASLGNEGICWAWAAESDRAHERMLSMGYAEGEEEVKDEEEEDDEENEDGEGNTGRNSSTRSTLIQ